MEYYLVSMHVCGCFAGTTPAVAKPTGPQPHGRQAVCTAALSASKTRVSVRPSQDAKAEELLAFSKPRARNISPASAHKQNR